MQITFNTLCVVGPTTLMEVENATNSYFLDKFGCDPSQFFLTAFLTATVNNWTVNGTVNGTWLVTFEIAAPEQEANSYYVIATAMAMVSANTSRRMANTTCDLYEAMADEGLELDCDSVSMEEPEIKAVTATMTTVSATETTSTSATSATKISTTSTVTSTTTPLYVVSSEFMVRTLGRKDNTTESSVEVAAAAYFLDTLGVDPSQFFMDARDVSWDVGIRTSWHVVLEILAAAEEANSHHAALMAMAMLNTTGRRMANTTCDMEQYFEDEGLDLDCDSVDMEEPEIKVVTATMTTVSVTEPILNITESSLTTTATSSTIATSASTTSSTSGSGTSGTTTLSGKTTSSSSSIDTTATTSSTGSSVVAISVKSVDSYEDSEAAAGGYVIVIVVFGAACVIASPFPIVAACRYRRRLRELPAELARKKDASKKDAPTVISIWTEDDEELDQGERLEKASDTFAGAELTVIRNVGAPSDGQVVIVKQIDESDNTVLCHVKSLGKDEWFDARMLAKKWLEDGRDGGDAAVARDPRRGGGRLERRGQAAASESIPEVPRGARRIARSPSAEGQHTPPRGGRPPSLPPKENREEVPESEAPRIPSSWSPRPACRSPRARQLASPWDTSPWARQDDRDGSLSGSWRSPAASPGRPGGDDRDDPSVDWLPSLAPPRRPSAAPAALVPFESVPPLPEGRWSPESELFGARQMSGPSAGSWLPPHPPPEDRGAELESETPRIPSPWTPRSARLAAQARLAEDLFDGDDYDNDEPTDTGPRQRGRRLWRSSLLSQPQRPQSPAVAASPSQRPPSRSMRPEAAESDLPGFPKSPAASRSPRARERTPSGARAGGPPREGSEASPAPPRTPRAGSRAPPLEYGEAIPDAPRSSWTAPQRLSRLLATPPARQPASERAGGNAPPREDGAWPCARRLSFASPVFASPRFASPEPQSSPEERRELELTRRHLFPDNELSELQIELRAGNVPALDV